MKTIKLLVKWLFGLTPYKHDHTERGWHHIVKFIAWVETLDGFQVHLAHDWDGSIKITVRNYEKNDGMEKNESYSTGWVNPTDVNLNVFKNLIEQRQGK